VSCDPDPNRALSPADRWHASGFSYRRGWPGTDACPGRSDPSRRSGMLSGGLFFVVFLSTISLLTIPQSSTGR
jgi:hypothetical protein